MELWRDVRNWVGLYQVSDEGRVVSLKRVLTSVTRAGQRPVKQLLKPSFDVGGRLVVTLSDKDRKETISVARLVMPAFDSGGKEGGETIWLDGDKRNNCVDNLRWGKRQRGKLTAEQILEVCQSLDSQRILAMRYGVSQATISAYKAAY